MTEQWTITQAERFNDKIRLRWVLRPTAPVAPERSLVEELFDIQVDFFFAAVDTVTLGRVV